MARARNIKPSFFTNLELGECDPIARLLFIGLWCIADRQGRLEDKPKQIKIQTIPYDNADCDYLLKQLHDNGFIYRYSDKGKSYIQINNFLKHQNPHMKEKESEIPPPFSSDIELIENKEEIQEQEKHSASIVQEQEKHETIHADSLLLNPDSLNLIPESKERIESDSPNVKKSKKFDPFLAKPKNVSESVWLDWIKFRKEIKKPLTETTCKQQADDLAQCQNPDSVIKKSIANSWQGLFPDNVRKFPDKKPSIHTGLDNIDYTKGLKENADGSYSF